MNAEQYANQIVPNPDRNDAPYYTSSDRWQDIKDAFEAGEKVWFDKWVGVVDKLEESEGRVKELETAFLRTLLNSKQKECEQLRVEAKKWWQKYMDEIACKK